MKDKKNLYYIGGAIAAYFLIIKPVLISLNVLKSKEEIDKDKEIEKFLDQSGTLTKTSGEWAIIADQIHEDLKYTALDDNKANAGYQVSRVKTSRDFAELYKQFGRRREYFFGIPSGSPKDLQAFIRSNLDDAAIQIINNNYKRKGISFQF